MVSPDEVSYEGANQLSFESGALSLILDDAVLAIQPKSHYASVEDARADIDPFLRSWEIDAALRFGRSELRFRYDDAEIIDRNPPPPGASQTLKVSAAGSVSVVGNLTVMVNRVEYPSPPVLFLATPDVETLWHRFEGYRVGNEPLLSMAYFCLTLVEAKAGGRVEAAEALGISQGVLSKLGELTSTRGDEGSARKFHRAIPLEPLAGAEQQWVKAAVKTIIGRTGEIAAGGELPDITMADLPPLNH